MDSSNQVVIPAPVSFSNSIPQSQTWTVGTTGTYYIQVTTASFNSMDVFYLTVAKNGVQYLKVVDVKRDAVFKYIYLSQSSNTLILTTTGSTGSGVPINLYSNILGSSSLSVVGGYTAVISGSVTTHTYTNLPAGYYGVIFTTDSTSVTTVTYQSYSYQCPYLSGFNDFNSVFSGCTSSSGSVLYTIGLPCLSNDAGTQACTKCLPQYTLSNGQCLYDTSCGARQYFKFGQCLEVNPLCDKFDHFTGACYSCLSSNH